MSEEVSMLNSEDADILSKINEVSRSTCKQCLTSLRHWCDGKVEFSCTDIVPTAQGCVIYVLPATQCSFAAFILLLERAVGESATVWGNVPGRIEVAVEFEESANWVATWEEFQKREAWQAAVAKKNSLPLALGIGMTGNDEILDLSTLSALFIYGGDTYAQGKTLQNILNTLFAARNSSELRMLYLEMDGVLDCRDMNFVNEVGDYERYACSFDANDTTKAWCDKVHDEIQKISNEVDTRQRLFDVLDCNTITEYNKRAKRPLPRIVLMLVNPPSKSGDGDVQKAHYRMQKAVSELFCKCGPRYGVHLIVSDFLPWEATDLRFLAKSNMAGRHKDMCVGCLFHGAGVIDEGDSFRFSGGPELCRATRMTMLYRSPENELYKIHKLGENVY